jgi:hypothetical protein
MACGGGRVSRMFSIDLFSAIATFPIVNIDPSNKFENIM